MDDQVVVVLQFGTDKTPARVARVCAHYGDAELWVARQTDPRSYILSVQPVYGSRT